MHVPALAHFIAVLHINVARVISSYIPGVCFKKLRDRS